MKLLHVLTTLDVGGAEMHVLTQIRGQTARGNEVRVAYLKGHGSLADDFRAAGASRVECVGSGPGRVPCVGSGRTCAGRSSCTRTCSRPTC